MQRSSRDFPVSPAHPGLVIALTGAGHGSGCSTACLRECTMVAPGTVRWLALKKMGLGKGSRLAQDGDQRGVESLGRPSVILIRRVRTKETARDRGIGLAQNRSVFHTTVGDTATSRTRRRTAWRDQTIACPRMKLTPLHRTQLDVSSRRPLCWSLLDRTRESRVDKGREGELGVPLGMGTWRHGCSKPDGSDGALLYKPDERTFCVSSGNAVSLLFAMLSCCLPFHSSQRS